MAFECRQNTKIDSIDSPTNHSDNSLSESVNLDQTISVENKLENLKINTHESANNSNVKLDIPFPEPSPNYCQKITDLPPALISEIFNFLDPKALGIVSCTSTDLFIIASEHHVWKEFYYERFGDPISPINVGHNDKSWKELFAEREFRSKTYMGRYTIDTLYGHTEAVRTVFVLSCKMIVFTSGYDQVVRMWDLKEGLSISNSRPLGCTIRAVTADSRLLVAGGTDGFIHGWRVENGNKHLFNFKAPQNQNLEFRVWEHEGPVTCLALDFTKLYSGSWDMTVRIWDRDSLKCLNVLVHNDWVWSLVPHENTIGSTSGSSINIWDSNSGIQLAVFSTSNGGNVYSLARSHTGKLLFTGGEDGSVHMFEITKNVKCNMRRIATWMPHSGSVYSLAFEFPWLVSSSSDGKISLIDVRKLLKVSNSCSNEFTYKGNCSDLKSIEPPQRVLHGFGPNLFSIGIGFDRIVCGGEEGVVRIWNFSQALKVEERARNLRGIRLENRMRRRKVQVEMSVKGSHGEQCSVAAKMSGEKSGWRNKGRVGKMKA